MSDFSHFCSEFSTQIFDDVRKISAGQEGILRMGYSDVETKVLSYLEGIGRQYGLAVRYDLAGNLWMRLSGKNTERRLISGSHSDSVIEGGNFDGLAGIVSALACACWMSQEGIVPEKNFDVVCWRCEEQGLYGCRGYLGLIKPEDLDRRYGPDKVSLGEAYAQCGVNPQDLMTQKPLEDISDIDAYYEVHIEQGPRLDLMPATRVGLVSGIRGNVYHRAIRLVGETAHSGAIDKEFRHDAFVALSTLNVRMVDHWQKALDEGADLVYTIGVVNTPKSASFNIVPGEVTFSLDIRTLHVQTRERFYNLFKAEAQKVEEEFGVEVILDTPSFIEPIQSNEHLMQRLSDAATQTKINTIVMPSGAGHDAQLMGQCGVPMAMIFVANQDGSHNPKEKMKMEDFVEASTILKTALEADLVA